MYEIVSDSDTREEIKKGGMSMILAMNKDGWKANPWYGL